MFIADTCPVCRSPRRFCWFARAAPFIVDYVLDGKTPECRLCDCADCGLRYFDARYTREEMTRLYEAYRGERYVGVRRRHEPAYTNAAAIGDIDARRKGVDRFLRSCLGQQYDGAVLDFGGDDGALIPEFFSGPRLVFDVSGKSVVPGVERVGDFQSLKPDPPRFVLLCHVLEHLPNPASVLQPIADLIPQGSKLYVEVPDERFRLKWLGPTRRYKNLFNEIAQRHFMAPVVDSLVRRHQRGLENADPISPDVRPRWRPLRLLSAMLPPIEDLALHEHINFFTIPALEKFVSRHGFRVIGAARDSGALRLLTERV